MALATPRTTTSELDVDADQAIDRRTLRRTKQLRVIVPLVVVWLCAGLGLALVLRTGGIDDAQLLLDPAAIAGLPWYTGLISNLGVLGWTVAAVAAAAGARVCALGDRPSAARFLRQAALLGGLLTIDDLFLLHSSVFPQAFGTSKRVIFIGYLALAGMWVLGNITEIRRTRWGLLAAAGSALAVSVGIDQFAGTQDWALVAEDTAKFLAIAAWATYFTLTARDIAESILRS
jgi:hypothetical protein